MRPFRAVLHWRGALSVVVWLVLAAISYLIPAESTYTWAMAWAGAVTFVAGVFTLGFVAFSRPSKDSSGKREWSGEWYWYLAEGANVLLVIGWTFVLRVLNADSVVYTAERVAQYRGTGVVFVTSFFIQTWLLYLWGRAQIRSRRALRADS